MVCWTLDALFNGLSEPGTFALMPRGDMLERIRTDYTAKSGMIFGEIPEFEQIIQSVNDLETRINAVPQAKVE